MARNRIAVAMARHRGTLRPGLHGLGMLVLIATPGAAGADTPASPAAAAAAVPAVADQPSPLAALLRQSDDWLLGGRMAPPELPRLLDPLTPADRLTAVAYMRRSGVLAGPGLDLASLLKPAAKP